MLSCFDPTRPQKTPRALTWRIVFLTALVFAVLQCFRPFFTLTDDNLTALYPFFSEVGHHLLNGQSPFYSDYLFGGHYNLLRDAQYFYWHPFYLLTSLLAGTPFRLWILDIDALFLYLITATGFVRLACFLRAEGLCKVADGWILFCALSYTFTMIGLVTCSSWLTFENNAGALPWLALGILQKEWRWRLGLIVFFSVHQILGGHLAALISNSIFLTLFAMGVSVWRRSFSPLISWLAGYAMAIVLILPLLVPAFTGFLSSNRSHGIGLDDIQLNLVPAAAFPISLFFGNAFCLAHTLISTGPIDGVYIVSLAGCASSLCFFLVLRGRTRPTFLEGLSLALMALAVLLVCRPIFVSEIMAHLPLFKSMRWPFRELVQFQFFFHLFLLVRPVFCTPQTRFLTAVTSSAIFAVPMLLYPVLPTLNEMNLDRRLVRTGQFDRYWDQVRPLLKPGDVIVNLYPPAMSDDVAMARPYSLMGGYSYAMLARVVNGSGYSQTAPANQLYLRTSPVYFGDGYDLSQRNTLLQERPHLTFIVLEHDRPFTLTLDTGDGAQVNLTPYVRQAVDAVTPKD